MNDRQREAVYHTDGPLLILAGAGSGKTTVLVNRIANLIKYGSGYHSQTLPDGITEEDVRDLRDCAEGRIPADESVLRLCREVAWPAWRILAITFDKQGCGRVEGPSDRYARRRGRRGHGGYVSLLLCPHSPQGDGARLGYSSHFTIYDTDDSRRLMKECMKLCRVEEKELGHKAILSADQPR